MREGKLWIWHMIAGIVIFFLLGLHMVIMHLDEILRIFNPHPGKAIEWANVLARSKMLFFTVTYIILLGAALFHGLYGLRNILMEMNPSKALSTAFQVILVVLGVSLFIMGTYAAMAAHAWGG